MDANRTRSIKLLLLASILWSIAGFLIKAINLNPFAIGGLRSGIAALVIFLYLRKLNPKQRGPRSHWLSKSSLLGAFSYAANSLLFVIANKLTTSANAILLQFTAPIWVALFSPWILKEKVRKSDWTSIIIVMLGMTLFFIRDLQVGRILGNILAIISGVGMAAFAIFAKMEDVGEPAELVLMGNLINFLICLPFSIVAVPFITIEIVLLLFVLGVFQLGIPYILYTEAIKHVSSLEAILITVLEPLLNPVWVYFIAGESPGLLPIAGGLVVLTAILLRGLYQSKSSKKTFSL